MSEEKQKVKIGMYWAATCGGCDVAFLDIEEKILDVIGIADIYFWPVAMDFKKADVEAMEDKWLDVGVFNGAIRNSENLEMAELMRAKCKVLVSFGSCACMGGIPGLANVADRKEVFRKSYHDSCSTVNPESTEPQIRAEVPEGTLTLPEIWDEVKALHQVVDVDAYVPGCPPNTERIVDLVGVVAAFYNEGTLPPKGAVIASEKSLCDECPREKIEDEMPPIVRVHEKEADPNVCFLSQGLVCMGMATRGGCGAACISANMPCRGCYGPLPGVEDQGLAALNALSTLIGKEGEKDMSDEERKALLKGFRDPLGTLYRFGLPVAVMNKVISEEVE